MQEPVISRLDRDDRVDCGEIVWDVGECGDLEEHIVVPADGCVGRRDGPVCVRIDLDMWPHLMQERWIAVAVEERDGITVGGNRSRNRVAVEVDLGELDRGREVDVGKIHGRVGGEIHRQLVGHRRQVRSWSRRVVPLGQRNCDVRIRAKRTGQAVRRNRSDVLNVIDTEVIASNHHDGHVVGER